MAYKPEHLKTIVLEYYLKTFMFIGFQQLSQEEQKKISMTETHFLLGYEVFGEDEC